jgi:ABC-type transporter Mla subunit MlaD
MRRIATAAALVAALAATLVATAGADDKRTYEAELFNAFGLVEGSELRVAGVKAGTVTAMDVTEEKTALITFEVGPEFPEFKSDASCSSEPQSLIAEYFLDCQPGSAPDPLEGPIPAANNQTTVQNDLVQNTLREPFKRRFQLILNEFGTALVGNSENLNAAIRAGAPALREFRKVLKILGRQNTIIAQLNTDADSIFARLTERREDVVRFIDEAEDTARVSADRRVELAQNFDLLDDFLFELKPVMTELGNLARDGTPLLTDLNAAAPGLNKLATNLPRFNNGARVSLQALGGAAEVGQRALLKSTDEIAELNTTSQQAFPAADIVAEFLQSIDDPSNAVAETCLARQDLREQPGEADRRLSILENKVGDLSGSRAACGQGGGTGNPGYTGLESLLNYAYIQTLSLNLYDWIGHGLHITVVGAPQVSGECSHTNQEQDWEALGGGETRDPRQAIECVALLGDMQPGITPSTRQEGNDPGLSLTTGLTRYDNSVCAAGSTDLDICDPNISIHSGGLRAGPFGPGAAAPQAAPEAAAPGTEEPSAATIEDVLERIRNGELPTVEEVTDALGLPPGTPLPPEIIDAINEVTGATRGDPQTPTQPQSPGAQPQSGPAAPASDLLDFLFGP